MKDLTFLIVDDSAAFRQILRHLIQKCLHWRVIAEASNGQEAIRLTASCIPDIVLLDINMPIMNGLEAIRHVRQLAPDARIITFSGYPDKEFEHVSLLAGANHYLPKEDLDLERLSCLVRQGTS